MTGFDLIAKLGGGACASEGTSEIDKYSDGRAGHFFVCGRALLKVIRRRP